MGVETLGSSFSRSIGQVLKLINSIDELMLEPKSLFERQLERNIKSS
jgi:hypothetical protein